MDTESKERKLNPAATVLPSEARVLDQIVLGLDIKEVAEKLELTQGTVRTYLKRSYARLGVHNLTQAALLWQKIKHRQAAQRRRAGAVDATA